PDYTPERHEAMTQAFENVDYNAWKEARGETKGKGRMMEVINEENFNKFVEIRQLRLDGDTEGADAIREELGLGQGKMSRGEGGNRGNGEGRGMHRSGDRGQNTGGKFVDENNDGICDFMQ
ncbi:hypothetical protein HOD96_01910, partial [Candidatus Falkowbacteria bacterium]|nr:hypothetical protein [Candidatus Falkowbacteria bacterium]